MKKRISSVLAICAVAFMSLCLSAPVFAQFRTSIQGVVTDPQGAVIPGATLTLTDTDTNHVVTATSNASFCSGSASAASPSAASVSS